MLNRAKKQVEIIDYKPLVGELKTDSFKSSKELSGALVNKGKSYMDKNKWKALGLSFVTKEVMKINSLEIQTTSQLYLSNRKEGSRSFTGNYVQYGINTNAEIAGIPLSIKLSVSTANGGPSNNMTGLNVNFDYNGLLQKLKSQLSKQAEKEKQELASSLKNSALAAEIKNLKNRLNSNELLSTINPAEITDPGNVLPVIDYKNILDPSLLDSASKLSGKDSTIRARSGDIDSLRQLYNSKVAQYKQMEAAYMGQINNVAKKIKQSPNVDDIIGAIPMNDRQRKFYENLMAVKAFQVGNIFPRYSNLYLSGAGMQGLNFEYNKKLFYTAVVVGKSLNIAPLSLNAEYAKSLGSGLFNFSQLNTMARVGIGRKESNNLIFSTVYTRNTQDPKSQNNIVLALSGSLKIKEIANFKAEVALSDMDKMKNHEVSTGTYLFAKAAWSTSMVINVPKVLSRLSLDYNHTGVGFNSLSQPFLRSDRDEVKAKIEQPFFKNKLKATVLLNYQQTNTQGQNKPGYKFYTYGGDLQLTLPKLPVVKVGYLGYMAKTDFTLTEGIAPAGYAFYNLYALLSYYKNIGRNASLNQMVNVGMQSNAFIGQKSIQISYSADLTVKDHTISAVMNTTQMPSPLNTDFYEVSGGYSFAHKKFMVSNTVGALLNGPTRNIYNSTRLSYTISTFKLSLINRLYSGIMSKTANIENISQFQFSWCLN